MLPSSTNSKNRLFIERDSKHRRITSNLGNTFRNSKWANYSLKNTNNEDRHYFLRALLSFIKILVGVATALLLLSVFVVLGVSQGTINWVNDHIDTTIDLFVNWSTALPFIWQFASAFLYDQFIRYIYGKETLSKEEILATLYSETVRLVTPPMMINPNRRLVNPSEELQSVSNQYMELLEEDDGSNRIDLPASFFEVLAYYPDYERPNVHPVKILSVIPLNKTTILMVQPDWDPQDLPKVRNRTREARKWLPANRKPLGRRYFDTRDPLFFLTCDHPLLGHINSIPELYLATLHITEQANLAKVMRWSYRYNVLHRKTLMNSHKLTTAKGLLGPGFFDSRVTKNNIWFSDTFSRKGRIDSSEMLKELNARWISMYQTNLTTPGRSVLGGAVTNKTQENFYLLSCYESSFQFFAKRIHDFSNLSANAVSSTVSLNSRQSPKARPSSQTLAEVLVLTANSLGHSQLMATGGLNHFSRGIDSHKVGQPVPHTESKKDLVVHTWSYDFLTEDQLELLFHSTNMITPSQRTLNFFEVDFGYNTPIAHDVEFMPNTNHRDTALTGFNHKSYYKLLSNENKLLKDVYLLSLLWTTGSRR